MKHFQLILFVVVALGLVVEAAPQNGTRHVRIVKHKHTRQVSVSGSNEGLIKGISGAVRNFGNNIGNGIKPEKDSGPYRELLDDVGTFINAAFNTTDSIIDDADDAAGSVVRDYYQIAKNLVGIGDGDMSIGFFEEIFQIVRDAAGGAVNIVDTVLDS